MSLKPTRGNIIVKVLAKQTKTEGGILLPDTLKSPHKEAEVISVSVGNVNADGSITPHEVGAGDRVILRNSDNLSNEVDIGNGVKGLLVTDRDILAIVVND